MLCKATKKPARIYWHPTPGDRIAVSQNKNYLPFREPYHTDGSLWELGAVLSSLQKLYTEANTQTSTPKRNPCQHALNQSAHCSTGRRKHESPLAAWVHHKVSNKPKLHDLAEPPRHLPPPLRRLPQTSREHFALRSPGAAYEEPGSKTGARSNDQDGASRRDI